MGKRKGSSDSEDSSPHKKAKHEAKEKDKVKKDKEKDKDKKDKKDKDDKKDKKDKSNDKEHKDKEKHKEEKVKDAGEKKEKNDKKEKESKAAKESFLAGMGMRELSLETSNPYPDAKRPFGIELDGSLVVDLAPQQGDEDSAASIAGIQIGWRVSTVAGTKVPEEEEGAAAKQLRSAEMDAAKSEEKVLVCFLTEEPDHWKQAADRGKKKAAGSKHKTK